MEYISNSAQETEALGERLAARLRPGDVIAYTGDLGAGKTAFTRGLARGLGVADRVTSPTFTIVNEYEGGRLPLFHFDLYRMDSPEELFDIGWEDYLAHMLDITAGTVEGMVCGERFQDVPWRAPIEKEE